MKWVCDLNETAKGQLAFIIDSKHHFAVHGGQPVSKAKLSKVQPRA
jgi:hypothetical protein